jgi:hypothetical protein
MVTEVEMTQRTSEGLNVERINGWDFVGKSKG